MRTITLIVSLSLCMLSCRPPAEQSAMRKTTIAIGTESSPEAYDPMIFGGFIEHFGRQIYGGVFEPGSPLADVKGFRIDVVEALTELKVPVLRWPGGCLWMPITGKRELEKNVRLMAISDGG
ncbi:MAG: hypothetical protein HKN87_16790 [Saprospiraceae bacterium]|nr:hypothetical protein [Saprospiraceae bacterium]